MKHYLRNVKSDTSDVKCQIPCVNIRQNYPVMSKFI